MTFRNRFSLFVATFLLIGFFFLALPEKGWAQELVCVEANGLVWCFNDQACGQACNDVCGTIGATPIASNTEWLEAQDTEEECRAISQAFGLGDNAVLIDGGSFFCIEDVFGNHTVGGFINPPLLCTDFSSCPNNHRTSMDQLGVPCGPDSRRSICPCGPPAVPNFIPPPPPIPTLSEWGLISLAVVLGILGIVGFMVIRRRKVTA